MNVRSKATGRRKSLKYGAAEIPKSADATESRAFQLLYLEFIAAQHSVSHSADFGSKSEQTQISQNFGQVQHTLNALTDIRYSLRT